MVKFLSNLNWWIITYSAFVTHVAIREYSVDGVLSAIWAILLLTSLFMFGWYANNRNREL